MVPAAKQIPAATKPGLSGNNKAGGRLRQAKHVQTTRTGKAHWFVPLSLIVSLFSRVQKTNGAKPTKTSQNPCCALFEANKQSLT